MATKTRHAYRPTESKYKGGAREMYVTYDLMQETRSGKQRTYPKVKRIYIAGDVKDWKLGEHTKRTGRRAHGVVIEYEQSRRGYPRRGFSAQRGDKRYTTSPVAVGPSSQKFRQVVEVPKNAQNVHFYESAGKLPAKYREAVQDVK